MWIPLSWNYQKEIGLKLCTNNLLEYDPKISIILWLRHEQHLGYWINKDAKCIWFLTRNVKCNYILHTVSVAWRKDSKQPNSYNQALASYSGRMWRLWFSTKLLRRSKSSENNKLRLSSFSTKIINVLHWREAWYLLI